jgi:probable F420-dependent oxidoreductase
VQTRAVKWGISSATGGPFARPTLARVLATTADELGFESLWGGEHPVVPVRTASNFPLAADGRYRLGDRDLPDPLVWLSFAAAVTSRIRLGTAAVVLPLRNPVLFAKEVASLDVLSDGRFTLGIGVGWLMEEFDALGVDGADRGERTDEYVAALRALWAEPAPSFDGRFVSFDQAQSFPKPVDGTVPVMVCGHSVAASRRAGRIGNGFFPLLTAGDFVERLPVLIAEMRREAAEAGRDPELVEITALWHRKVAPVSWYEDTGVDRLLTPVRSDEPQTLREELTRLADAIESARP